MPAWDDSDDVTHLTQRSHSLREGREHQRAVGSNFRQLANFHGHLQHKRGRLNWDLKQGLMSGTNLSHHAQRALGAQNELVDVRASRNARNLRR